LLRIKNKLQRKPVSSEAYLEALEVKLRLHKLRHRIMLPPVVRPLLTTLQVIKENQR